MKARTLRQNTSDRVKIVIPLSEVSQHSEQSLMKELNALSGVNEKSLDGKNPDAVVKSLFSGIVHYVNQKRFNEAERLRKKLIELSPMSVKEIVKSGEIIEQKKSLSMNPLRVKLWAELFDNFSQSEASAFYYALKQLTVKKNQPVFQQGNCDNRLYFVESGKFKLNFYDYDQKKNVVFAYLEAGDLAGVETFFTLTNHTTNMIAVEDSKISYLEKSEYQKILSNNHLIEPKLFSFCESRKANYQKIPVETKARRAHKRYETDLKGKIQRIDGHGRPSGGASSVTIADLSEGGLRYIINSLKIGEAAHLHNSKVLIRSSYQKNSFECELKKVAKVVSLKFHPLGDCSVHVQFDEPLDEEKVIDIAQNTKVTTYLNPFL